MNDYARNVITQIHQTIDAGLEHIETMRRCRELQERMTRMEEECAWLEYQRRELLVEIGAETEGERG